jgi:hypothetical protein
LAGVYNHRQYLDESRTAPDALARFIATLTGRNTGNVAQVRKTAE